MIIDVSGCVLFFGAVFVPMVLEFFVQFLRLFGAFCLSSRGLISRLLFIHALAAFLVFVRPILVSLGVLLSVATSFFPNSLPPFYFYFQVFLS